jgi:hypothetical protein
MGNGLRLEID